MSAQQKNAAINKIKAQQQAANKGGASATAAPAAATASSSGASAATAAAPASTSAAPRRAGGAAPPRARWAIDLTEHRASPSTFLSAGTSSQDVVPFGFSAASASSSAGGEYVVADEKSARADEAKQAELIYASAMAIAQAPGKQLLMTAFMLWMSGNSLQIFSIVMLGMAMWTPVQELFNVHTRFARFADSRVSMLLPKLTFVAIQFAALALGLYKCNTMGLLPTATADWVDATVRAPVQVAGGGL
jgi:hypothetical protein